MEIGHGQFCRRNAHDDHRLVTVANPASALHARNDDAGIEVGFGDADVGQIDQIFANHEIRYRIAIAEDEQIRTSSASKHIVTGTAAEIVAAGSAEELVIAVSAEEHVFIRTTQETIVTCVAVDNIGTRPAGELVITHAAQQQIIGTARADYLVQLDRGSSSLRSIGRCRVRRNSVLVHDILRTQVTDNRVLTTIGGEDDAVSRFQCRDIDGVIGSSTVNGDRVEIKAGFVEVTNHLDRVAGNRAAVTTRRRSNTQRSSGADDDFLDVVELRHHDTVAGDDDFRRRVQHQGRNGRKCCRPGVDDEGFRRGRIVLDSEGIDPCTTINEVYPASGAVLIDEVSAVTSVDQVIAGAAVDRVTTTASEDDVTACSTCKGIGRRRTRVDGIGGAGKTQVFGRGDRVRAFRTGGIGNGDRSGHGFVDREVGHGAGEDRDVVATHTTGNRIIASTTSYLVVTVETVEDIIPGTTIHDVATAAGCHGIGTIGNVIAGSTRKVRSRIDGCNTDIVVTDHPGRNRIQRLDLTQAIGEAGNNSQDASNLCLCRSEAGSGCVGDVRPGRAVVGRHLPLVRDRSNTVDIGDTQAAGGQGLRFGRRLIIDRRRTGCSHLPFSKCGSRF